MNIMYAADDNYAEIMAVSIKSLIKHNNNVNILILSQDISQGNIERINKIMDLNETCKVQFIEMSFIFEIIKHYNLTVDRGSLAQYLRFFGINLLPDDWSRCLYLDCDTLIMDNLDVLYENNLDGYVLGGIEDAFSKWHYRALELDGNNIYINSGVMLIDVNAWKNDKIEERIVNKIEQCKGEFLQGDQGLINSVLKGHIKKLPLRYNLVTYYFDFSNREMKLYRKPLHCYSIEEINEAKLNPSIIHFTSSFASMRPWNTRESKHPYYAAWKKEFESLENNIKLKEKSLLVKAYEMMPHLILLTFLRVAHAYVKPILYMLKRSKIT